MVITEQKVKEAKGKSAQGGKKNGGDVCRRDATEKVGPCLQYSCPTWAHAANLSFSLSFRFIEFSLVDV